MAAIEVIVSNSVSYSVVTDWTGIVVPAERRCPDGMSGEVNETYLLPNTVLARTSASTFDGIEGRYSSSISSAISARWRPPTSAVRRSATRPTSTPLNVTFEPGSTTRPARSEVRVSAARASKSPRYCLASSPPKRTATATSAAPASRYGGWWRSKAILGD